MRAASAAGPTLDLDVAADVIAVVMRVQDMRDAPAEAFGFRERRRRDGGIDRGGRPGRGVAGEIDEIVGQYRDLPDVEARHGAIIAARGRRARLRPCVPTSSICRNFMRAPWAMSHGA
jgi:hypothetical protein